MSTESSAFRTTRILFLAVCCIFFVLNTSSQTPINSNEARILLIDSLEREIEKTNKDTNRLILLNKLSEQLWRKGDKKNALEKAQEAKVLAEEFLKNNSNMLRAHIALAKSHNNIGSVQIQNAEYGKAIESIETSISICKQLLLVHSNNIEIKKLLAFCNNNIGGIYYFKGDLDKSLEAYFISLKIYEELGNKEYEGRALDNIGLTYHARNNLSQALAYYEKALLLNKQTGYKRGEASCYDNIGSIHFEIGDSAQKAGNTVLSKSKIALALDYYLKALTINKETENENWMAYNFTDIAAVYKAQSQYTKSLDYHTMALDIREKLQDKKGMGDSRWEIGNMYLKQNKIAEAKKEFLIGLEIARQINTKQQLASAYLSLSECDSMIGNYKEAFRYHKLYAQIKDSIFNSESSEKIAEMQTKYETEKKEDENRLLTQENDIKTFKIERQNTERNILLITLSLLLLVGVLIYNSTRLKQKNKILLEKELRNRAVFQAQEKEKIRISQELHDGLGPLLSLIKLNLSSVERNPSNEKVLADVRELANESLKEVKSISHSLMPSLLDKKGLHAALADFVEQINSSKIILVELIYDVRSKLRVETEINVYRIVQEAMNNILKHAEANTALIRVLEQNEKIELFIHDDGKGFHKNNPSLLHGNGLNNIYSRADFLKGECRIESKPNKGSEITILFSVNQNT